MNYEIPDHFRSWAKAIVVSDVAKARERKYSTRREAAQAAAAARWGNRSGTTVSSPATKAWVEQKSTSDCTKEFNRVWGHRTKGNFVGLDVSAANTMCSTLNELFQQFPDVSVEYVGSSSGVSRLMGPLYSNVGRFGGTTMARAFRGFGPLHQHSFIQVNTSWFRTKDPKDSSVFGKNLRAAEEMCGRCTEGSKPWHPSGTMVGSGSQAMRQTVVHEFGHQLDFHIQQVVRNKSGPDYQSAHDTIIRDAMNDEPKNFWGSPYNRTNQQNYVGDKISMYAKGDRMETFAEAFTSVMLSDKPAPLATRLVNGVMTLANYVGSTVSMPVGGLVEGKKTNVVKARPRKYATRTEAAQAAARARWGNRVPAAKTWVNGSSIDEINANWESTWGGQTVGRFDEMSVEAANSAAQTFTELFNDYPEIAKKINVVGSDSGVVDSGATSMPLEILDQRVLGQTGWQIENGVEQCSIMLNAQKFNDAERNYTIASGMIEQQTGFHPKDIAQDSIHQIVESVVTHEFGHVIDNQLSLGAGALKIGLDNATGLRTINLMKEMFPAEKDRDKAMELLGGRLSEISEYAGYSPMEMFAEGFAQFRLGTNPSPMLQNLIVNPMERQGMKPVTHVNESNFVLTKAARQETQFERTMRRFNDHLIDLVGETNV